MAGNLPTGFTSRVNVSRGKSRKQYRASLSDPSQKNANGQSVRISSKWFDTLGEAKSWMEDKRGQLRSVGSLAQDHKITIGEACRHWIELAEKAGVDGRKPIEFATADRYRSILENIIEPTLGMLRLTDLTSSMVTKWRDQLVLEKGHDAAKRSLGLLKMVTRYQVSVGGLLVDPATAVRLSYSGDSRDTVSGEEYSAVEKFLSPADVSLILRKVDEIAENGRTSSDREDLSDLKINSRMKTWAWIRVLIYLLVSAGPRMGEVSALRWGDVDWEKNVIYVRRALKRGRKIGAPKNRTSIRTMKMGPIFMAKLRELYVSSNDRDPGDYIFGGNPNSPLNDTNFRSRHWHYLMRECGMLSDNGENLWTPHDLRHYFASTMILARKPDEQIAEILGHANTIITRTVYSHLFNEISGEGNTIAVDMEKELLAR